MSDCTNKAGSFCTLGLFNSKPSENDCASCGSYSGPIRGVGDRIDRIAAKTGLKRAAEVLMNKTGKKCNCGKRRAALNKAFPTKDH